MRYTTILVSSLALFLTLTSLTKIKSLTVSSTAFTNNGNIPVKYTCTGQQVSPPLNVANIPPEAKSLVIIVCDPDAQTKITTSVTKSHTVKKKVINTKESRTMDACTADGFTHWILWNVDVNEASHLIPEDFRGDNVGQNSSGTSGYVGMCPPTGTHHYHFMVYALDTKLNVDKKITKSGMEKVMQGHIVAKGELVGLYNKTYK
jgi:Raf kinase inhibitor-like YbhB/YbcL family protein